MEGKQNKDRICHYLCILCAAISLLGGAGTFGFASRFNSLGAVLGIATLSLLVAAAAYAAASPLNKARCKFWLWGNVGVFVCSVVMFVLYDLARLRMAFNGGDSGHRYNAMAIVATVYVTLCLASIAFTVVRIVLLSTGRYMTDAEHRAAKEEDVGTTQDIKPRAIDTQAVVDHAKHERTATRMVVEQEEPTRDVEQPRQVVSPLRARELNAAKVQAQATQAQETQGPRDVSDQIVQHTAAEQQATSAPATQETGFAFVKTDPELSRQLADADSLMAEDDVVPDQDIRSEVATHHIRQPLEEKGNDLYNDFSYSDDDDGNDD